MSATDHATNDSDTIKAKLVPNPSVTLRAPRTRARSVLIPALLAGALLSFPAGAALSALAKPGAKAWKPGLMLIDLAPLRE